MGYATKRVKKRRHNDHLRLHAATTLLGVRYSQWSLPVDGRVVHGYEIFLPFPHDAHTPYMRTLAASVRLAAMILGVD